MALARARSVQPFPALVAAALFVLAPQAGSAVQGQTTPYVMYAADGRHTVVVRTSVTPETIALEQLTTTFGLTFTEDRAASGLVIGTKGDPIFAFPGQSFVRTSGRVIALDGPVQRDRNAWTVPTDFLTKALGPAVGQPIVIRRSSRLILVGPVRVPEITARLERTGTGARVVITIHPATAHRVTRDGSHLTVHFDATALDTAPFTGFIPEFAPGARVDGSNLIIDLGPQVATHRADDDRISGALTIELLPAPPPASAKPVQVPPPAAPPQLDLPSTGLRTIVIDAGHGGDDIGAVGAGGAKEKDLTLALARRLKAAIESRLGLRALLTRDGDDTIPPDRRTELANNNKADVFLSLHVNWSVRPDARGAQVYTPAAIAARPPAAGADARKLAVPVVGGGSRVIDPVPWETAQLPFVAQSTAFGAVLARQFADHAVPLFARPAAQAPMRILTGAHMPAVLIELAFLSNADDERSLGSGDWQSAVVESVIAALTEVRRGIPGVAAGGARH